MKPSSAPAQKTARAVSRLLRRVYERFADHPVNRARVDRGESPATGIITRGAGKAYPVRNVITRQGLTAAIVSAECTVIGLGRIFGFETVTDPRFTADTDTDLDAKLEAVQSALERHPIVYLHIKGTDVAAHDRQPERKRDFVERIDTALAPLLEADLAMAITADHSTDSNTGSHTGDPVPSLLCAPGITPDACTSFSESACRSGGDGRLRAADFLQRVLDAMQAGAIERRPVAPSDAERSAARDGSRVDG